MASPAPTRAASTTRGSRSCSSTASWVPSRPPDTCPPPRAVEHPVEQGERRRRPAGAGSAPTQTPASTAATSASSAPASTRAGGAATGRGRRPVRACARAGAARGRRHRPGSQPCSVVGDRLGEVGDPRAPAGGDVVVGGEHPPLLDGRHGVEGRPLGEGLRGLVAADGVGQHDQVRRLPDDVLGGQLRVAAGGVVGAVGDVLQAEQRVDAADEGGAGRGEEGRVELVVDPHALDVVGDGLDRGLDPVLHVGDDLVGLVGVAGGVAEGLELGVAVVQVWPRRRAAGWARRARRARRRCRSGRR